MLKSAQPKLFDIDGYGFLAVAVICGLMFFLLIKPLEAKRQEILQKQQASDHESDQTQQKIDHLTVMLQKQKELSNNLTQARHILADNSGIDNVIREIEGLALKNDLSLEEITPLEEKSHDQYHTHSLSLFLEGMFPDLRLLLAQLHDQLAYLRIEELSVVTKNSSETGLCKIHLNLIIFSPKFVK
jgi:Tfp pilus assembly protein PilO